MKKEFLVAFFLITIASAYAIPIIDDTESGISVFPTKAEITIKDRNEVNYNFTVKNLGDNPINVSMKYLNEGLKEFSRPLTDSVLIKPNSNENFTMVFFRNGTDYIVFNSKIRFYSNSSNTPKTRMIMQQNMADVEIWIVQEKIADITKIEIPNYAIIILMVLVFLIIFIIAYYIKKRGEKNGRGEYSNTIRG
jgi:hypothetical protein